MNGSLLSFLLAVPVLPPPGASWTVLDHAIYHSQSTRGEISCQPGVEEDPYHESRATLDLSVRIPGYPPINTRHVRAFADTASCEEFAALLLPPPSGASKAPWEVADATFERTVYRERVDFDGDCYVSIVEVIEATLEGFDLRFRGTSEFQLLRRPGSCERAS
jgi:hypothetical protein